MTKETILYPGLFASACPKPGQLTIEQIVDKQLVANGYPVLRTSNCAQPNICDLLSACPGGIDICAEVNTCLTNGDIDLCDTVTECLTGGGVDICTIINDCLTGDGNNFCTLVGDCMQILGLASLNGISGSGSTGDEFVLGGTLDRITDIATSTFDFSATKDNVKLDINDAGGSLGPGETARFYGTDGTQTAQIGVYTTSGGAPSASQLTSNSSTTFYSRVAHNTALETLLVDAGRTSNGYSAYAYFDVDTARIGLTGSSDTNLTVEKFAFTGGTDVIKLINLPTFADNAAAATALLPIDSIYKTATGELRIRV